MKVYCDHLETLELFLQRNTIRNPFTVVSLSPAMLTQSKYKCISPEPNLVAARRSAFVNSIADVTQNLFLDVYKITNDSSFSIFCTHFFFRLQKPLFYTMALEARDFTEPRYVLLTKTNLDPDPKSPFQTLLSTNSRLEIQTYAIKMATVHKDVSLRQRIHFAGFSDLFFRFCITFEKYNPFRKYFLVLTENELLKDTAWGLFKHGYGYRKIPPPTSSPTSNFKMDEKLWRILERKILDRYSQYADNDYILKIIPTIKASFERDFCKYHEETLFYNNFLKSNPNAIAVLTNSPGSNQRGCALHAACKMNSIQLASFQHGVSMEISRDHREAWCFYDNNISDITFVFNDEAKKRSIETAPIPSATTHVVGTPRSYSRKTKKIRLHRNQALKSIFLSTSLYRGYDGSFMGTMTDLERLRIEVFLLENILAKTKDAYVYKTYPYYAMRRFGYDNPIHHYANKFSNIEFFSESVDIRYFIEHFKLVITSRATSTFSWALLSGLPLVFINHNDEYAVFDSMKDQLKKSVFYFEFDDNHFADAIISLLNTPYGEKLKLWQNMEPEREKFIKQYISNNRFHAGKNAAEHLISYINQYKLH